MKLYSAEQAGYYLSCQSKHNYRKVKTNVRKNDKIGLSVKKANSQKLKCREIQANGSKIDERYVLFRVPLKLIN